MGHGAKVASLADYGVEVTMPTEGQTHQEPPRDPHDEHGIVMWIPLVVPLLPVAIALVAYFVKSTVL
jgi:hypothetical protein